MKVLNGKELADYIKARQIHEVRALRQAWQVEPRLVVVQVESDPAAMLPTELIRQYGEDILVDVDVRSVSMDTLADTVSELNADRSVHGIVVRPFAEEVAILSEKDVDALGEQALSDAAMPMAVLWLLAGYNVDLHQGKTVVVSGGDAHVTRRLERMLADSEVNIVVADPDSNAPDMIQKADILIATGSERPAIFESARPDAVIVDTAGVGPLFVCALFENVIRAARRTVQGPA